MRSTNKKKNNRRKGRIRRFFLRISLILLVIFAAGIVFVNLRVTQNKIKQLIQVNLAEALEKPVKIESVNVNPWGSFEINGISIGLQKDLENPEEILFFTLNKLEVKYKFLSLFKRRLRIFKVLIDKPELQIISLSDHQRKKISIKRKSKQIASKEIKRKSKNKPLLFSLILSKLKLKDFKFTLFLNDSSYLCLDGLNLEVSRVFFPRNYYKVPHWLSGRIRIYSAQSKIILKQGDIYFQNKIGLDLSGGWVESGGWNFQGDLNLSSLDTEVKNDPHFSFEIKGDRSGKSVQIVKASLKIAEDEIIKVVGNIGNLIDNATYDLIITGDRLDVNKMLYTGKSLISEFGIDIPKVVEDVDVKGSMNFFKGKISGDSKSADFTVSTNLNIADFSFKNDTTQIKDLFIRINSKGNLSKKGLRYVKIDGQAGFQSIETVINDTVAFNTGPLICDLNTELNKFFFPEIGEINIQLEDLFKGVMKFKSRWHIREKSRAAIQNLFVDASLNVDSLDIGSIFFLQPNLTGLADFKIELDSKGLKKNHLTAECRIDSLTYSDDLIGDTLHIFNADMNFQTDTLFSRWIVDSCLVRFDDLFSLKASGGFSQKQKKVRIAVNILKIDNSKIMTYIPEQIKKDIPEIQLSGKEIISFNFEKYLSRDSSATVYGNLIIEDAEINLLSENIRSERMEGSIVFRGSPEALKGRVDLSAGRIISERIRSQPLIENSIAFNWGVYSGDSLSISEGQMNIPSLKSRANFIFSAGHLQTLDSQEFDFSIDFNFNSKDSVEVIKDIYMRGRFNGYLNGKTLDPLKQWITFQGDIKSDSVNMSIKKKLYVNNVMSRIPFSIDIDRKEKVFLGRPSDFVRIMEEYGNRRELYKSVFPEIGSLRIESVDIFGYRINNIDVDMLLTDGRICVPWFMIDLFEGSVGGDIEAALNTGKLKDINYKINAAASQINSSAINKKRIKKQKKSEIDAVLNFSGRGLDVSGEIEPDGYFHILNIGPSFTGNLLRSIDPSGTDRSITMTRRLIDMGWKPGIFSFELRHGYVYPSLNLQQPWFSPVRLPERLEYGRLPLSFFLKQREGGGK